jgi:iron complex outermembrane receptor protein
LLLTSTALIALPVVVFAQEARQDTTLQPIVIQSESPKGPDEGIVAKRSTSASKTDTALRETPQAVSVVTGDQIAEQGANTVSEALRYTPGVFAESNGYDIRYDWLYIRGFNTYGMMWLDGLAMPGDPNNYSTPTINPYALERVEVIKGPASVLYGRTVPGGLVNQVSKRPQTTPHNEISIGTSGFGGVQASFDTTGPITEDGIWSYRLLGQARNMHTQIDHERDRQSMIAPSLTWSPDGDTSLTLYGYYQHDEPVFNPRFYPAYGTLLPNPDGQIPRDVFLGDPSWGGFRRDYYHAGYEFEHSFDETWTVRQNLRYGRSDQHMDLVLVNPAFAVTSPPTSDLSRVTAISDDWSSSFAVDTQVEAKFETGNFDQTALFGIDYVHGKSSTNFGNTGFGTFVPGIDYLDPVYGYDFPIAPVTASGMQTQNQVGLYMQDQIRAGGWLGTFGLRYDMSDIESRNRLTNRTVTTDDKALTWRAGLTYLFDNGLAPYVSYSTAFLPVMGTDISGNPFKAQEAEQFEVGVKYEPVEGRGMINVSFFNLDLRNALTPVGPRPASPTGYAQDGKQRVRGIELEGKYELTPELDMLASYAYSDSEVLESSNVVAVGNEVLRLPKHQASLWLNYRPSMVEGLSLSAGVRYMSAYQTDVTYLDELRIPARTLVDIGASYDFGAIKPEFQGTKLQVNVSNLFDEKYVSHCLNLTGGSCNYGAGRTITASLKYTWQ